MSKKNPYPVPGKKGMVSHKRFTRSLDSRLRSVRRHLDNSKQILERSRSSADRAGVS